MIKKFHMIKQKLLLEHYIRYILDNLNKFVNL